MSAPMQHKIRVADGLELSRGTLLEISTAHAAHFQRMIDAYDAGVAGIRKDECEQYLATWKAGVAKLQLLDVGELQDDHLSELLDALDSGDYDIYLTPAEKRDVVRFMEE